jgi:hypothetical protein
MMIIKVHPLVRLLDLSMIELSVWIENNVEAPICIKISNFSFWERRFLLTKNTCRK